MGFQGRNRLGEGSCLPESTGKSHRQIWNQWGGLLTTPCTAFLLLPVCSLHTGLPQGPAAPVPIGCCQVHCVYCMGPGKKRPGRAREMVVRKITQSTCRKLDKLR